MRKSPASSAPRLMTAFAAGGDGTLPHVSALAIIALVTLPLLFVFLGTGDAVDMMELFNLVPIREAIRDHHWLMPTLDGVARLEKPPLPVWIPASVAMLIQSDSLWVLRFPSVLMALLTAFATYGFGCTFFKNSFDPEHNERKYALLAAVLLPAMLVFNRQAHLASYDIYATAFLTCGAFFLARAAEGPRIVACSVLAGIATGLSILSKGPVPVATVMLPLGIWFFLFHRRRSAWLAVLLAAVVSILIFLPWLLVIGGIPGLIAGQQPTAWHVWYTELFQFGTGNSVNATQSKSDLTDPWYYYLQMFLWVAPLTPTLIAALVMPFMPSNSEPKPSEIERRGRWLFWLALVVGLVMLSVPSEKKARYALQLFPFAALLCAGLWQEFRRLPAHRKLELPAVLVLAMQALFFIVPAAVGVIGVLSVGMKTELPHWAGGPATAEVLSSLPRPLSLFLFVAAGAAGIYFGRVVFRRRFALALPALAAASWLLVFAGQSVYRAAPGNHTNPARYAAEDAMRAVGPYPIYSLPNHRPWLSTLYYADRPLPQVDLPTLIQRAQQRPADPFSLIFILGDRTKNDPGLEAALRAFEDATHREPDFITKWYDEGRHTAFYHFQPLTTVTRPSRAR